MATVLASASGISAKRRRHLGGAFQAMLGREAAALGFIDIGAIRDAKKRVVRFEHFRLGKIGVVGGDQRQVMFISERDQSLLNCLLVGHGVAHELDVKPAGKGVLELDELCLGNRVRVRPARLCRRRRIYPP